MAMDLIEHMMIFNVTQPNYIRIDRLHIFFDFDRSNYNHYKGLQLNRDNEVQGIFIFITKQSSINESLKFFIEKFGKEDKITIVIPNKQTTQNLATLFDKIICKSDKIRSQHIMDFDPNIVKKMYSSSRSTLHVHFEEDRLRIELETSGDILIGFPDCMYDEDETEGIFENAEQRLNPGMFRDQLIEAFKRDCPASILENFKTDDDIMDFIAESGEWKIEEE